MPELKIFLMNYIKVLVDIQLQGQASLRALESTFSNKIQRRSQSNNAVDSESIPLSEALSRSDKSGK